MNLLSLPTLDASQYDRSKCTVGAVHLGFGAFHRAHQAVFIDGCMEKTGDLSWGIAAVNLRAADRQAFNEGARATEGYLLKTTSPEGDVRHQLIRPHVGFYDWSENAETAENLLNLETVHMVTITVTESGYSLNEDHSLNTSDPAITAELSGGNPTTVYGFLARALARRAAGCGLPLTVMCCDNIRANGKMLSRNFLKYLEVMGETSLLNWVQANVRFPCSMVDRITPRSTDALMEEAALNFPGQFLAPVHGESFIQWVLERDFAGPVPDLAKVGVQIVDDVDPYEEAKIRILNGGHTGLCYLGALAGHRTFDQAMRDPVLRAHFDGWEIENVLPGLTVELPFDKNGYLSEIADRFGNAAIADDLARICMDGWSKMPIFMRPTLEGCLRQGISPDYGYTCIASWYVYARRFEQGTMQVPYYDHYLDALRPLLDPGNEIAFAQNQQLWANLPSEYNEFVPGILSAIKRVDEEWPA